MTRLSPDAASYGRRRAPPTAALFSGGIAGAEKPARAKPDVFLIDDDPSVQRAVSALLEAAGYEVRAYDTGQAFLEAALRDGTLQANALRDGAIENGARDEEARAILLLDVCMPGIQGLDLQERLNADGVHLPVIVMTAHGDVPMAVRAMRNGATDFLEKPFTVAEITSALQRAEAALDDAGRKGDVRKGGLQGGASQALQACFNSLSPREAQVFHEIVSGATNKEIARLLGVSPRTIEVHRHNIMQKMRAANFAELVRMGVALGV